MPNIILIILRISLVKTDINVLEVLNRALLAFILFVHKHIPN